MSKELAMDMNYEIEEVADELSRSVRLKLEELARESVSRVTKYCSWQNDGISGSIGPSSLNKRELAAIYSLMLYAAANRNVKTTTVETMIEKEFKVDHIARIPRQKFQTAVGYLVDFHLYDIQE